MPQYPIAGDANGKRSINVDLRLSLKETILLPCVEIHYGTWQVHLVDYIFGFPWTLDP